MYICYSADAQTGPDWLENNFTPTGEQITRNYHTWNVWQSNGLLFGDGHRQRVDDGNPLYGGMPFRCDLDGSNFEVLAHNFRNNWEVTVDSFGSMWQSDNDNGSSSCRVNFVMEHGNYGYRDERTGADYKTKRTNLEKTMQRQMWHQNDPGVVPNVLITGAGPIGVMAAAVCLHAGARHIVVTDLNPKRLELARRMGATRIVDVRSENLGDVQQQLGMDEGFDVGLEMSGNPAAFNDMISNMCHGGKIAMLGIPSEQMAIDWTKVIFNMLTLKGIYGREMYETWYKMSVMIESGLDIAPVITHRLPYTAFAAGFSAMREGKASKVVLNWAEA